MTIEIIPLSDRLGAEVRGIDLGAPQDDAARDTLRAAFLRHHMLLVRGQPLDDDGQIRFCETFGPIQAERMSPHLADSKHPGIHYVANTRADAVLPEGDTDLWLHSDQTFYDRPSRATSLHAIDAPARGGETVFGNIHHAWDALPDDMKRRIDGLRALNCYLHDSPNRYHKVQTEREADAARAVQPVVRTHPDTGRKAIYVNRLMTDRILDIDEAESRALLEDLFDLVEQVRFLYAHRWRVGDTVIWDNASLVHGRTPYDHRAERRTLRRVTVAGEAPF